MQLYGVAVVIQINKDMHLCLFVLLLEITIYRTLNPLTTLFLPNDHMKKDTEIGKLIVVTARSTLQV